MSTSVICADWAGRVIDGKFTLLQWLGGTESSGVFITELAGDRPQKAAIKFIPADAGETEALLAGWTAAAALSHPHLMRLFRTGRCRIDGTEVLYVVTEYAEESLSEIIPERPLTPAETREMLDPIIDALSYLHERGFVHGHLKPSNTMVVGDQLKLSVDRLYLSGQFWEHFPAPGVYDAPETATQMSPAADAWSLGVTLVETLTQHPPRWDKSTGPDPVVPESMPQPFADIARACLRRDPARRCTIEDVKARLGAPLRAGAEPAGKLSATARKTDKLAPARIPVGAIIAAVVALLVLIAYWRFGTHRTAPETAPKTAPAVAADQNPAVQTPEVQARPVQPPAAQRPTVQPPSAKPPVVRPPASVPAAQPEGSSAKSTENGAVAERVMPHVPVSASETIQGTVKVGVRVAVDANGNVSSATLDSPGPSHYFANLALDASRRWKFKPAQGPSVWILHYAFRQTGTEVTPVAAS
jgi:TonB family protein